MATKINEAQNDENVKVILIHGGKFFSTGNDVSVFLPYLDAEHEEVKEQIQKSGEDAVFGGMVPFLNALNESNKPIVAVVRKGCVGI